MYVCMYVCMYVYVCMHVCMYVCVQSTVIIFLIFITHSTRTLIIGLSKRPTNAQFMIEVQVTAALSSDLLRSNYVGQLSRVRLVKQTLDDQVIIKYCILH